MRGWRTLILGALIAVTGAAAPAAAQAPGTAPAAAPTTSGPGDTSSDPVDLVAAAVAAEGWYADPGAVGDREELDRVASRLRPNGEEIGFALLDAEPPGSSQAFAEQVVDALAGNGEFLMRTVVVLSPADVGVVSDTWDDEAIDTALDEAIDELRANPTDGLATFADVLGRQSTMDEDGDALEEEDGGSSFPTVLVLAIAGMGGLALLSHVAGWSNSGGEGGGSSWGSSSYRRRRSFGGGTSRSRGSSSSRRSSGGSSPRRGRGSRRL
jgi:hypothetical protein